VADACIAGRGELNVVVGDGEFIEVNEKEAEAKAEPKTEAPAAPVAPATPAAE